MFFKATKKQIDNFNLITPTPSPLIETTVNAANNVMITPTTNAVGIMAKLSRLNK